MPPTDLIILFAAATVNKKVAGMLLSGDIDPQKITKKLRGVDEAILPEGWTLTKEEIEKLNHIKASTLAEFTQKSIEAGLFASGPGISRETEK